MNRLLRPTLPLLLFVLFVFVVVPATAQVPRTISFQGVLADASGVFVPDGAHVLTLRLYEGSNAASAIYSETHNVTVVRGVFDVVIGSQTPIPGSIGFDRAYFLGVSVDNGAELRPRTAMTSVPYALRAAVANDLAPGASIVRSVNGRNGDLTFQGAGSTTVTQSGNTVTITSSGGGGANGIQGVQNIDGTIAVANPNGPVATIGVADSAITGSKIASRAVTAIHLADTSVRTANIRDGSITQAKVAPGVSFPPSGNAGGDLTGTYPSPIIAAGVVGQAKLADNAVTTAKLDNNAVTTAKLDNDAVTSAKIVNGTIVGADISATASLAVATITTTGSAAFGTTLGAARVTIQGSGATAGTTALDINDNTGALVMRVRDNGAVGLGTPNPVARLEVAAGVGTAFHIRSGSMVVSTATIPAAAVVTLPPVVAVQITDDGVAVPIALVFPAGIGGQIMYVSNGDADNVIGPFPIASGQTRQFIFVGGAWRLVN